MAVVRKANLLSWCSRIWFSFTWALLVGALAAVGACGGGGNAEGTGGDHPILVSFLQAGQDNVPLNAVLEFQFSGPIDPASLSTASLQVREGNAFGLSVPGTFFVSGATVRFQPQLPGLCDLSDSGFHASTSYRVTIVGYPEEFAIRGIDGHALNQTYSQEFSTRPETSAFDDQVPGVGPDVLSILPANGSAGVPVHSDDPATGAYEGNEAVVVFSENLDPCSVNEDTVRVHEYERGNPTLPAVDQSPANPFAWGGAPLAVPQRVRCTLALVQTFTSTELRIRPEAPFTEWPDNALIVVEITFGVKDFGGQPLPTHVLAFTTENRPVQNGFRAITWQGETPIEDDVSTADVNSGRAPSKAQGYLLFAGDGDNGSLLGVPSKPALPPTCSIDRQVNDGSKDDFDPTGDTLLDTGTTANTCLNETDGSTAVVWEFASFRIRSGITVRVIGANPAILLVQGDVLIENGARLLVRGDGTGGTVQGRGGNGVTSTGTVTPATGGKGSVGGGSGGNSVTDESQGLGKDGQAGFGSPGAFTVGGLGAGQGNIGSTSTGNFQVIASSPSGGGGGHASKGGDGTSATLSNTLLGAARGLGGGIYPTDPGADKMPKPSAGSGGGAAGIADEPGTFYDATGGAGGAGGGFVDFSSSGDIFVFGTIDAAGSRGGTGATNGFSSSGGGGGGSGGGIRLLTPNDINVTGGTLTAAGGPGGAGAYQGGPVANGGTGGAGRLVLEDGDSVVTGILGGTLSPTEGGPGFYRSTFDASRFQGGGLTPELVTQLLFMGPTSPTYVDPVAADFPATLSGVGAGPGAGIPAGGSRGFGFTGILIEARGYPIQPDGKPDLGAPTDFYTVGYFKDSAQADAPDWVAGLFPGDVGPRPADNVGDGIANLSGNSFLQLRITFFLPAGISPNEPGPFLNLWNLQYKYDQ